MDKDANIQGKQVLWQGEGFRPNKATIFLDLVHTRHRNLKMQLH